MSWFKVGALLLSTILYLHGSHASFSGYGDVEGPEDVAFRQAWGIIHAAYPRILEILVDELGMDSDQETAFRARLEARTVRKMRSEKTSERCTECVVIKAVIYFKSQINLKLR